MAALEVVTGRVAVPMLRPALGKPPAWHVALDYIGLFLHYFVATLAAALIFGRCLAVVTKRGRVRHLLAHGALGGAAVLALVPLVVAAPGAFTLVLEAAFATAVILIIVAGIGRTYDMGVQLGLVAIALPLLLHTLREIAAYFSWAGGTPHLLLGIASGGGMAICIFAIVSPYLFAPRPLVRAMTKGWPIVAAMATTVVGAYAVHAWYLDVARAVSLATGVTLRSPRIDPRLALYLLALATLTWTLASCWIATAEARRRIGQGIALVALGGYAFQWSHHYLLPLLGLALIADAARRVRDQELADMPIKTSTPPITDAAWSSYITAVKAHLETVIGASGVHALTTRGDDGVQTSQVIGERRGIAVRTRIERFEGSVISLDIVAGHEFDERSTATLRLSAVQPRSIGAHPLGPPAAPRFASGDATFDERFRVYGNLHAFDRLFDGDVRARATTTLNGWFAYWDRGGVRHRVYPGRGAPLDHPMPLSDLALGGPVTPERLIAVIALLLDIAARGCEPPDDAITTR